MSFILENAGWLSWVVPILGAVFTPAMAKLRRIIGWYATAIGLASSAIASTLVLEALKDGSVERSFTWIEALNLKIGILIDPLSAFMANIAAWIGTLILVYSNGYMSDEKDLGRYYFFMLLFIGSMIGLVLANGFLQLYIFWELVGLCSYALIGFWYHKPAAARAGMKAFVVTRVGDCFLLAGILIIYIYTGTFNFLLIKKMLGEVSMPLLTISIFILLGAMGKSAQFPLHIWLPDAMEGPTPVSALIHAATMVKAGVYLISRVHTLFSSIDAWLMAVAYIGSITAFIGATMALVSIDIKRILAYSTISQLGLLMSALGIGTGLGWFASQFHLMSHAIFKSLLFLCAGSVMHATGTTDITRMGGLRKDMPITFAASLIGAFALAGIPPLNGFWSKELILSSSLNAGNYTVFTFIFLTSILTVAYSVRWINLIFLGERRSGKEHIHESPLVMIIPLIILSGFAIISGFLEKSFEHYMIGAEGIYEGSASSTFLISLAIIVSGGLPTALAYRLGEAKISNPLLKRLNAILSNGYYLDKFYDAMFIKGFINGCWNLFRKIEVNCIDGLNYALSEATLRCYNMIKRSQTGVLQYNMILIALGMIILLLIMLIR